jgi:hypothetical protein
MALLNGKDFTEGSPRELEIFALPPVQTAVEKLYYIDCRPVSQITGDGPLEFNVSGQGQEYLDLRKCKLYVRAKVVKADGTNLAHNEKTSVCNNTLNSLFSQVEVTLGGKIVSTASNLSAYRSYIQTLLNNGVDSKESRLQSQLWYMDDDDVNDPSPLSTNAGLGERYEWTKESKEFDMLTFLGEDIFNVDRYMLNGVDLQLKLYRNSPQFCIISGEVSPDYKIIITEAIFKAAKVKVNPGVIIGHAKALEQTTAKYPFVRTELKTASISTGQTSFVWNNVFGSTQPTKLVIGFLDNTAMSGDYAKNPFNFERFSVSSVGVYVDGQSVPDRPLKLTDNLTVTAFDSLFEVAACTGNDISRSEYTKGSNLYAFCLEPQFPGQQYMQLVKNADVRIEVHFDTPTTKTISCIVYAEHPALLSIDEARNVIYNN